MDGVNLFTLVLARVFEGELGNTSAGLLGHDLQALDHARHNFVLQSGVETFGVFAHDDQIDVWIARGNMRQIADRPEVCVKLKLFPQRDVNAGKAASHGRSDRTF